MPARLPDEELTPVEGTPPPQGPGATVAPTEFGLNTAGEALGQAATIGYRAQGFIAHAQAEQDAKTVLPTVTEMQGKLDAARIEALKGYDGQPDFVANQLAAGQKVVDSYAPQRAQMTPGQQTALDRASQELLVKHQAAALQIQNQHALTQVDDANKAHELANLNDATIPTLTKMQQLDKTLAETAAGDPGAVSAYRAGSADLATSGWQQFLATHANLPQYTLDSLKPQFDLEMQKEQLSGAGRLGQAQAMYQGTHLVSTVLPQVNTALNSIDTTPSTFGPVTAPGGTLEKALAPLGSGQAYDSALEEGRATAAYKYVKALIGQKDYDLAQGELDQNANVNAWLPKDTKDSLENELTAGRAKKSGADEAEAYTFAQNNQADIALRASEGVSIYTPDKLAEMKRVMTDEQWAKYQVDGHNADLVFQQIGGPISKVDLKTLGGIRPPTPADYAADPSLAQAKQVAFNAAQAQITERQKDPAAWALGQDRGASVKGGGKVAAGPGDSLGDRLAGDLYGTDAQHKGFANSGQVDLAAGTDYSIGQLQAQVTSGFDAHGPNVRLMPLQLAADKADSYENAANASDKYAAGLSLRNFLQSLPPQIDLAHGVTVSPRMLAVRELTQAHMKRGDVAAIMELTDSPAGKIAFGRYVQFTTNPELQKPLPAEQSKELLQQIQFYGGKYLATNLTPGDSDLNPGRMDYMWGQARQLMSTGMNPAAAAKAAAASLTDGYEFDGPMRIPLTIAHASYPTPAVPFTAAQAGGVSRFGGALASGSKSPGTAPGSYLVNQGLGLTKTWALANDGANLSAPPSDLAIGDSRKAYAGVIQRSGVYSNIGDNQVALMVPRPEGQMEMVTDIHNRPITMSFQQAIADGQSGHSLFERPPPPTAALSTGGGHPIHNTTPAIGAAALAGSIAANPQAVVTAGDKVDDPLGGAPPGPPPVPGGSQPVPSGQVGSGNPPPAPGTEGMNATQRALAAVNASPQTLALFAGPEVGGPTAEAAAAPQGYEGLNVTANKAVQLLLPEVRHQEDPSGDPTAKSGKGALGLMQITPPTLEYWAPRLGMKVDVGKLTSDPAYNLAVGTGILNHLTSELMVGKVPNAGIALALAAYNGGPGVLTGGKDSHGVYHQGWLTTIGDPRGGKISTDEFIARIPYKETREYVTKIMDHLKPRLAGVVGAGPPAGAPG